MCPCAPATATTCTEPADEPNFHADPQGIDEARGDFWQGIGFYHSHSPGQKADYLRKVLRQALRLEAEAGHATAPAPAPASTTTLAAGN